MKRSLSISLVFAFAINACTVTSTQAVDWKKVKKYSIIALEISCVVAAVAALGYLIVKKPKDFQKSSTCRKEAHEFFEWKLDQYDLTVEELQQAKIAFLSQMERCFAR